MEMVKKAAGNKARKKSLGRHNTCRSLAPGKTPGQKKLGKKSGGRADSNGRRSGGEGGGDGRGHCDAVPRGEPLRLERHWGATLRWKGTRKEEGGHFSAIGGEAEMG